MDPHDVGMSDTSQQPRLLERAGRVDAAGIRLRQQLERHLTLQVLVDRAVHGAEYSRAHLLDHPEVAPRQRTGIARLPVVRRAGGIARFLR